MAVRASGFARIPADLYQTPAWVVAALAEHVRLDGLSVWEPACGGGQMVRALAAHGANGFATDIIDQGWAPINDLKDQKSMGCVWTPYVLHYDFTADQTAPWPSFYNAIITNPPYGAGGRTAERFIDRGLQRLPRGGILALLLPVDFDSAKGRARFFGDCPEFAAKIVLRRRIMWFEPEAGSKVSSPSANHAWFIWERSHIRRGAATLYAPSQPVTKAITREKEAA